jgi:hypothetical protein
MTKTIKYTWKDGHSEEVVVPIHILDKAKSGDETAKAQIKHAAEQLRARHAPVDTAPTGVGDNPEDSLSSSIMCPVCKEVLTLGTIKEHVDVCHRAFLERLARDDDPFPGRKESVLGHDPRTGEK